MWGDNDYNYYSSPAESMKVWAWEVGQDHTDKEYLLHDFDVWMKNPHFTGRPGPHPEDDPSQWAAENFFSDGTPVMEDPYAGLPRRGRY